MNVIITPSAEADLLSIGRWIAADNPPRAATFLEELRLACHRLADAPRASPLVERYRRLGVRQRVYKDYLIFYRVRADRVEVLHVIHGARDYDAILSQDFG